MSAAVHGLQYRQVDVFTDGARGGNGLAVFWNCPELPKETMQSLTIELRQFEAVFVQSEGRLDSCRLRVFTMEEELDFAGHPVMGAAAVLHEKHGRAGSETWRLLLNRSTVTVDSEERDNGFAVTMHQPRPTFAPVDVRTLDAGTVAGWIGVQTDDVDADLPLEVVSTGLPYLIVPVRANLSRARISIPDLQEKLRGIGAKFLYVYDTQGSEGRSWDNLGLVEDIATGSAAGPVAAYLCRHGRLAPGEELTIRQGTYAGRPSRITARVTGSENRYDGVDVSGMVRMVATGIFD